MKTTSDQTTAPMSISSSHLRLVPLFVALASVLPLGPPPLAEAQHAARPNHLHKPHQLVIINNNNEDPSLLMAANELLPPRSSQVANPNASSTAPINQDCPNGLLTFELSTGFIYKPASAAETLAMVPSTLQLTDCLESCLQNSSCLAINFEMGLCVLLSSSAQQNPASLYSSQFPVFTIYAEKKCLLASFPSVNDNKASSGNNHRNNKRRQCQRAWTFERVAGYEMRTKPRRKLKLANKELCMEACLTATDFECRSANWYRQTGECTLSDQDRHSISQAEASDQRIRMQDLYGPSNLTYQQPAPTKLAPLLVSPNKLAGASSASYYYTGASLSARQPAAPVQQAPKPTRHKAVRQLFDELERLRHSAQYNLLANNDSWSSSSDNNNNNLHVGLDQYNQYVIDSPASAMVDYLENNCIYEPNKLCEFRKIQNKILKTVDSIYQDIGSLEECKQKCLQAPYRCYSFDYGDTSERVCRTSHLDQASLMSVKDPYLEVVGAITYELASCFNVTIQCGAREMVARVSSSKMFRGKIYAKSRPVSCQNDVRESLQFELAMKYHDEACDVRSGHNQERGVFSNDIIIQHHDRIVTTQDVGLSVYCQYDLGNRSITNTVDLAIERIDEPLAAAATSMESKTPNSGQVSSAGSSSSSSSSLTSRPSNSLTITSLATTVVRSPNVTMRITNMNGQPISSATVGDRLALLFEIKEKTSPFGIFVREIVAMDGSKQVGSKSGNHSLGEPTESSPLEANKANSVVFIDGQGCPTDANIMGPLQKMDPAGQRILAPFDAFKFPTSEVVFFRAVVSSCVSECKPAACAGPASSATPSAALDFELSLGPQSGEPPGASTHLVASTRNMQPAPLQQTAAFAGSTSAMPSPSPSSPPLAATTTTATAATMAGSSTPPTTPAPTSLSAHRDGGSSSSFAADTMTTVAGFGSSQGDSRPPSQQQEEAANFVATNMTNNHQGGKIQPRPSQQQQQQNSTTNDRPELPAEPLDLTLLTSQQKQQLVKLFEQRLRSPPLNRNKNINLNMNMNMGTTNESSNSAEMVDLYGDFLANIMLMLDANDSNSILSRVSPSPLAFNELAGEQLGNRRAAQLISGQPPQPLAVDEDKLESFVAHLLARLSKRTVVPDEAADQPDSDRRSPVADILGVLNGPPAGKTDGAAATQSANRSRHDNDDDPLGVNSSGQQQQQLMTTPQQHFDGWSNQAGSDLSPTLDANQAAAAAAEISPSHNSKDNNNGGGNHAAASPPAWQVDERKRFTSYGRRRRRSVRQGEQEGQQPGSDYVRQHVSQGPDSHYLDVVHGRARPFSGALVEMYHVPGRVKRQVEAPPQLEELVVQSIKIVDRLHFSDEQDEQPAAPAARERKSAGSSRSTSLISAQQQQQQRQPHLGNRKPIGPELGAPDEQSTAGDRTARWSALSLIVVGMLFIFAQTLLVLICLLDWTAGKAGRSAGHLAPPVDDGSTVSSRCASALSIAPSSGGGGRTLGYWPEDSARLFAGAPSPGGPLRGRRPMERPLSSASGETMFPVDASSFDRLDSYLFLGSPRLDCCNRTTGRQVLPINTPNRMVSCWKGREEVAPR